MSAEKYCELMPSTVHWPRRMLSGAATLFAAGAIPAAAATAFGYLSARRFGVRYETLALMPRGHEPFRVLHIGDMHLVAGDRAKRDFIARRRNRRSATLCAIWSLLNPIS